MRRGQVRRFHRNEPAQKGEDHTQDAGNHGRRNTRHAHSPARQPLPQLQRHLQLRVRHHRGTEYRRPRRHAGAGEILRHGRHAAQDRSRRSRDIDRQHRNDEGLILPAE